MSRRADTGACPICGKRRDPMLRPFCSKRCKDLDLARWLTGDYAIPGAPNSEANEPASSEEDPELH